MSPYNSIWEIPGIKPGVVTGQVAWDIMQFAKAKGFAIPAFNCTTSSSVNSCLEAGASIDSPIMIQFSEGGSCFFAGKSLPNKQKEASILGSVAGAHYTRNVAAAYGIPVIVHSDHCAKKLLPWFDGMLEADKCHFETFGEPLFSSHMLDLSEEPHEENIGICEKYFKQMAPMKLILEMEIGITGGVEDGVDNSGVSKDKLYTTPEEIWMVYEKLSPISPWFTIAAAFGNVHGVYKPGNVKLRPEILGDFQIYAAQKLGKPGTKPLTLVFHGGSGSEKHEIDTAVGNGVVKMNVDTDTQWAYWEGIQKFYRAKEGYLQGQIGNPDGPDKPNKSYYDPRVWIRKAEESMVSRVKESCTDLHNVATLSDKKPQKVLICGGGNAAHVFIPYFAQQGYETMVWSDFKDEAERMQKAMDLNGGITVKDRCDPKNLKEYKACPMKIAKDPAQVVPLADVIIAALPSFAMANTFKGIKPHLKKGCTLYIMPGQGGGDFVAKDILGDEIRSGKLTVAGILPMPLNCRIMEWGKTVDLAAFKACYDLAAIPAKNAPAAAQLLSSLLAKKVNVIGNYIGIHLHASNPNLHPGRMYGLWKNYKEGVTYPENPLFYETWDDESSKWVQAISEERCMVWKEICKKFPGTGEPQQVPMMKPYIEAIYQGQIADTSSLTNCFKTNDGFKGFRCPMKEASPGQWVPDFANRYFTEDIPEGLAMYKGIADLMNLKVPVIDEILGFFQAFMGKEYLKDGALKGANMMETKSPQRYGKNTIEAMLAD